MSVRPRSCLASLIGWLIVGLIVVWGFGLIVGSIRFVVRALGWLVVLVVLVVVYLALRSPDD